MAKRAGLGGVVIDSTNWEKILNQKRCQLYNIDTEINPLRGALLELSATHPDNHFSHLIVQRIWSKPAGQQKIDALLDHILRGTFDRFQLFCDALTDSSQSHIVDIIYGRSPATVTDSAKVFKPSDPCCKMLCPEIHRTIIKNYTTLAERIHWGSLKPQLTGPVFSEHQLCNLQNEADDYARNEKLLDYVLIGSQQRYEDLRTGLMKSNQQHIVAELLPSTKTGMQAAAGAPGVCSIAYTGNASNQGARGNCGATASGAGCSNEHIGVRDEEFSRLKLTNPVPVFDQDETQRKDVIYSQDLTNEEEQKSKTSVEESRFFDEVQGRGQDNEPFMTMTFERVSELTLEFIRNLGKQAYTITYPLRDGQFRGCALIINNKNFDDTRKLPTREGSDVDEKNLECLWLALGFNVIVLRNQTSQDMMNILVSESERSAADNRRSGLLGEAFVLFVLSHGKEGGEIYGRDGSTISVADIQSIFEKCEYLLNKPKLFFIQACQGEKSTAGVVMADSAVRVHEKADTVVFYATVNKHVAYRNTELGSWFVRKIVKVFLQKAHQDDVASMFTVVNGLLSEMKTEDEQIQIAQMTTTLLRKAFLLPLVKYQTRQTSM